ncbi:hypothetical protein [Dyadobacter sp. CY323]|uniref:hypothetical protein n=1 Tax=Dyadobacter sp. CY323 TaxID=2907302 RepID=UPI001F1B5CDA|nr:hypothetical protein [Dyadobacter sp. CY323]MCE6991460.1 hypothetical protein [Dyadobacter sp. CY323]
MKRSFTFLMTYVAIFTIAFGCDSNFMTDDFDDLSEKIKAKNTGSGGGPISPGGSEEEGNQGTPGTGNVNLACGNVLPNGFQCIASQSGASTTTTYKIPELVGAWDSKDFDFCVSYSSDGTGVITYKASGFSPGSVQNIKWGAMVNSKGELIKSNAGTIYIVHQSTGSTPVDSQIAVLSFKQSTKQWYGFDLVPVSSCGGVASGKGTIMVWCSLPEYGFPNGHNVINVSISSVGGTGYVSAGQYKSAPACGATYCYTREVTPGEHRVSGKIYFIKPLGGEAPPPYSTSKTVTVYANQCTTVDLQ